MSDESDDAGEEINPPQAAPSIMDIRAAQGRVEAAWDAVEDWEPLVPSPGRDRDRAIYEERVREMGQAIHDRAVALYGLDTTDVQEYLAEYADRLREPSEAHARLLAQMQDYSRRSWTKEGLTAEEREEWSRVGKEASVYSDQIRAIEAERAKGAAERHQARVNAYRGTIAEVQAMGGNVDMSQVMNGTGHKAARQAVTEVGNTTPAVWVAQSNATHASMPLYVRPSKGRAHYISRTTAPIGEAAPARGRIYISDADDPDEPPTWVRVRRGYKWERLEDNGETRNQYGAAQGCAVWQLVGPRRKEEVAASVLTVSGGTDRERERIARHEFAHRIEGLNRRVSTACLEFRRRRTTNEDGTREAKSPIDGRRSEPGWRDGFVTHYIGRDYGPTTAHSEVFSMGSEAVWNGTYGSLEGDFPNTVADNEHRNLILGLYATAK